MSNELQTTTAKSLAAFGESIQENVDQDKSMGGVVFGRFDAKGDGVWHADGDDLGDLTFMVDLPSALHGWMAWMETVGGTPEKVMVPMMEKPRPARPEDMTGYRPWSKAWAIGMIDVEDPEFKVWFENNTWGWELQYQAFMLETVVPYFKANKEGGIPLVRLTNSGKRDKNGNFYPVIELLKWVDVKQLAKAKAEAEKEEEEAPEPEPAPRGRRRRAA